MVDITQDIFGILFLHSLIWGAVFGLIYDMLGIVRLAFVPGKKAEKIVRPLCSFVVFICDFVFCVSAAAVSVLIMYSKSGGLFRGMVYVGMAIGFLLFRFSLGFVVRKIAAFCAKILRKLIKIIIKIVWTPILWGYRKIILLYHLTFGRFVAKIKTAAKNKKESHDGETPGEEDKAVVGEIAGRRKEGRISFGRRDT